MHRDNRVWPEGMTFEKTVILPTVDDPINVIITLIVPSFDKVIEAQRNRNPNKAYQLLRQFIIDWDLEDKLTDLGLMSFLSMDIDVSRIIYAAWCDHMKEHIAAQQPNVMQESVTIN